MKDPFAKDADTTTRYEIEKRYNRRIKRDYQALADINKRFDALTKDSEAAYEQKERAFTKDKVRLEKQYSDSIEVRKRAQKQEIAKIEKAIADLKAAIRTEIEAFKLDHKKSAMLIEDDIQALENERKVKVKEIEKRHLEAIKTYEEKLNEFKQNLTKNLKRMATSVDEEIDALSRVASGENQASKAIYKALQNDLKAHREALESGLKDEKTATGEHTRTITGATNAFRRRFNQRLKAIDARITQDRAALESPFNACQATIQSLVNDTKDYLSRVKDTLKLDYDFERNRLETAIKAAPQSGLTKEEIRDLNQRLKLAELRRNTLEKQASMVIELIARHAKLADKAITNALGTVGQAFESFGEGLKANHNRIKAIFAVVEDHVEQTEIKAAATTDALHPHATFKTLNAFVDRCFSALDAFEKNRANLHVDAMKKLKDVHRQIDDIEGFLDSLDARKEISINKSKLLVEQEDAALRYDMRIAKLRFDLDKANLEHEARIKKHHRLSDIKIVREQERLENTKVEHQHALSVEQLELAQAVSDAVHQLRKTHVERDIELLTTRRDIETERIRVETAIEKHAINREFDMEVNDVVSETREATTKIDYEIDAIEQTLRLADEKRKKLREVERDNHEKAKRALIRTFERNQQTLREDIEDTKRRRDERLSFIDRALERETESALKNIRSMTDTINHERELIKPHYEPLKNTLDAYEKTLKDPESSLKSLLILVARPFAKQLEMWLEHAYERVLEATRFQHDVTLKRKLKDVDDAKKRQTLRDKANQEHERQSQRIVKQKEQAIQAFLRRLDDAKKKVSGEQKTTLRVLKDKLAPVYQFIRDNVEAEHRSLDDAIVAVYEGLNAADRALVERARANHKKARAQTAAKFEQELQPLEAAVEENLAAHDQELDAHRAAFESKLAERTATVDRQVNALKTETERLMETKKHHEKKAREDIERLNADRDQAIAEIDQKHTRLMAEHEKAYTQKLEKLHGRLEDAGQIVEYERKAHRSKLDAADNLRQESVDQNAQRSESQIIELRESIESIEVETKQGIDALNAKLKATNEAHEAQMLTGAQRLEESIEEAARSVDRDAGIQREKLAALIADVQNHREAFRHAEDNELKKLKQALNDATDILRDSFHIEATAPAKALTALQDDFIDRLVRETARTIADRD